MNNYLLLRNNKETGPYSFDALIKQGLKQYDLVWIEGKSAAWRYPCEVEELKPYAPAVEEQPFDRFARKESVQATCNLAAQQPQAAKQKPRIRIKAEWSKVETPAPAATAAVAEPPVQTIKTETVKPQAIASTQVKQKAPQPPAEAYKPSWESSWLDWQQEKNAVEQASKKTEKTAKAVGTENDPPVLETKFSQSLNEIKERYTATVLKAKDKAVEWHKFKSLAILAMLAIPVMCLGVWLGHKWTAKEEAGKVVYAKTTPDATKQNTAQPQADDNTVAGDEEPAQKQPAAKNNGSKEMIPSFGDENDNKPAAKPKNKKNTPRQNIAALQPARELLTQPTRQTPIVQNKRPLQPVNVKPAPQRQYNFAQPDNSNPSSRLKTINPELLARQNGANAAAAAQRAEKKNNDDDDDDNSAIYSHTNRSQKMGDYVNVETEQPYAQSVQDMKLNVENVADVPLDLVVIDVEYFDASNRFRNGQTVHIKHIPAGGTINVKVPDNPNAARIKYRVSLVSAEQKGVYLIADNR